MTDTEKQTQDYVQSSSRTWLALLHFSGIIPLFVPSYIIWFKKRDEIKKMSEHLHAVIAFQSTIFFMLLLGCWVLYIADNPRPIYGFLFLSALFTIKNALKVLNGLPYKYFGLFGTKTKAK